MSDVSDVSRAELKAAFEKASADYPILGAQTATYSRGWWTITNGVKMRQADLEMALLRLRDRADARSQAPIDIMTPHWALKEDEFLIMFAPVMGAAYVAAHDLGRPGSDGVARLEWLNLHCPKLVRLIEQECEEE